MIVKFDSFARFEIPNFWLCNVGSTYTSGTTTDTIGMLCDTSDEELLLNFNAVSEFNLRVNRVVRGDDTVDALTKEVYDAIENRRMIFVDNVGYFIITSTKDGYSDGQVFKDISAQSCETEIQNKMIPYIEDGTYQFTPLLENLVETIPLWTIGTVDALVAAKYRTFEDVDTDLNCLSFMLQNMQDAYECIFVFDCINRTISVYDQSNYVVETSVHLTKEDVIKEVEITEDSTDLYTAISVHGDEDLNISHINPLGSNTIYNFAYYKPWMTSELRTKVTQWEADVAAAETNYYTLNLNLYDMLTEQSTYQSEIDRLTIQLDMYKRCRENIVASTGSNASKYAITSQVNSYNRVITSNGGTAGELITIETDAQGLIEVEETLDVIDGLISDTQDDLDTQNSAMTTITAAIAQQQASIATIRNTLTITSYFVNGNDTSLLDELVNYIFEGSYTDEYVTVNDVMTYAEKFVQMKTLYDRAKVQLGKASVPTQEFTIETENFLFETSFQHWSEQLETGCLINVELEPDDVAMLFLCTIEVNYDDRKMSLTFGNRYNRFDPKALFDDVLGNIQKSANTLGYITDLVYPIKTGIFNSFAEALSNSRNLTKDSALSATNQEIIIDDTGYTGRRISNGVDAVDGFDPRQVKLVNNALVMTDDAWDTCKLALGEIILANGTTVYGINAEVLMGNIIIGNELHLINSAGQDMFTVTEQGIYATISAATSKYDEGNYTFAVYGYGAPSSTYPAPATYTDQYYLDQNNGNVYRSNGTQWSYVATLDLITKGENLVSRINMEPGTVQIEAKNINLTGAVTVSSFDPTTQAALLSNTTVKTQYYLSTSSASATGGSWSDTVPTWSSGKYVWTRTATTKTNAAGTSTTTYSTAVYDANMTSALSTASSAYSVANSKNTIYYSTSNPPSTGTYKTGDMWVKYVSSGTGGSVQWTYSGSAWVQHQIGTTTIIGGSITADLIAANAITSNNIYLFGKMSVFTASDLSTTGGYIGYMSGMTGAGDTTDGIAIGSSNTFSSSDTTPRNYLIVTTAGVRMTHYNPTNTAWYSLTLSSNNLSYDGRNFYVDTRTVSNTFCWAAAVQSTSDTNGRRGVVRLTRTNSSNTATETVTLYASDTGGALDIKDADGTPACSLHTTERNNANRGALAIYDSSGLVDAELFSNTYGGELHIRDSGTNMIEAWKNSSNQIQLRVCDTSGNGRAILWTDSSGNGFLTLYSADGSTSHTFSSSG